MKASSVVEGLTDSLTNSKNSPPEADPPSEEKNKKNRGLLGEGLGCIWFLFQNLDTSKPSTHEAGKEEVEETFIALLVTHMLILRALQDVSRGKRKKNTCPRVWEQASSRTDE